ncbi:unnamed protein product, partial [Adineta steineri]
MPLCLQIRAKVRRIWRYHPRICVTLLILIGLVIACVLIIKLIVLRQQSKLADVSCQSFTYSSYKPYSTGNQPWSISIADIDNDNKNDIIVLNALGANFGIYFNQGNGIFQ